MKLAFLHIFHYFFEVFCPIGNAFFGLVLPFKDICGLFLLLICEFLRRFHNIFAVSLGTTNLNLCKSFHFCGISCQFQRISALFYAPCNPYGSGVHSFNSLWLFYCSFCKVFVAFFQLFVAFPLLHYTLFGLVLWLQECHWWETPEALFKNWRVATPTTLLPQTSST